MHQNSYGYWEDLDYLPVQDCSCDMCIEAARLEDEQYEAPRKANRAASGIISAAMTVQGLLGNPGLAANALPNSDQAKNAQDSGQQIGNQAAESERRRRSGQMDSDTRASGNRRGWSGQH